MSLRDRLKTKKEAKAVKKAALEEGEIRISIEKVTNAVAKMKNSADLGNIIKEFAKFLNTLEAQNASITLSGNFDLGQRTLLNCVLSNFLEDSSTLQAEEDGAEQEKPASKLIKKRKSVKQRLAEKELEPDD